MLHLSFLNVCLVLQFSLNCFTAYFQGQIADGGGANFCFHADSWTSTNRRIRYYRCYSHWKSQIWKFVTATQQIRLENRPTTCIECYNPPTPAGKVCTSSSCYCRTQTCDTNKVAQRYTYNATSQQIGIVAHPGYCLTTNKINYHGVMAPQPCDENSALQRFRNKLVTKSPTKAPTITTLQFQYGPEEKPGSADEVSAITRLLLSGRRWSYSRTTVRCVLWEQNNLTAHIAYMNNSNVNWTIINEPTQHASMTCFNPATVGYWNYHKMNDLKPGKHYVGYCITDSMSLKLVSQQFHVRTTNGPQIFSVKGCLHHDVQKTWDCPTNGLSPSGAKTNLTITGMSFGVFNSAGDLLGCRTTSIGGFPCIPYPNTIKDENNTSTEFDGCTPFRIVCPMPVGDGQNLTVAVGPSKLLSGVSYARPVVDTVSGSNCFTALTAKFGKIAENCSRVSGIITISGSNFGRPTATVLLGGEVCRNTTQTTHSNLTCILENATATDSFLPIVIIPSAVILSAPLSIRHRPCDPGFQIIMKTPELCEKCPPARFRKTTEKLLCEDCNGKVIKNSTDCEPCPQFSSAINNGSACLCKEGTYYVDPDFFASLPNYKMSATENETLRTCQACPENWSCEGDRNIATIKVKPGFFAGTNKSIAYLCPEKTACGVDGCTTRYTGPLCANCAPGFARNKGFECLLCPSSALIYTSAVFGVLALVIIVGWLTRSNTKQAMKHAAVQAVVLKIFLSSMQVNSMITQVQFEWPEVIRDLATTQGAVTSTAGALNLSCLFPGRDVFFNTCLMYLMLPFVIVGSVSAFFFLMKICMKTLRAHHLFLGASIGIILVYLPVVVQTFSMFSCRTIEGVTYLLGDVTTICYTSRHIKWVMGVGFPSLLLNVFGVPLAVGYLLRKNSKLIHERHPPTMIKLSYFFKGYREEHVAWEIVIIARKVAVAFISSYFKDVAIQFSLMLAVTTISLVLQTQYKPFSMVILNRLEMYALLTSWLLFIGGTLMQVNTIDRPYKVLFTVGMAGSVISYLLVFIFCILRAIYIAKKAQIMLFKEYIKSFKNKEAKAAWKANKSKRVWNKDTKIKCVVSVMAENLIKLDLLSASDPRCCLFVCKPGEVEYTFFGQTETIDNNHNPIWMHKFELNFEPDTMLSFRIYDDDEKETVEKDQMCSMVTTISDLIDHPGQAWNLRNMHNAKRDKMVMKKKSTITFRVDVEEEIASRRSKKSRASKASEVESVKKEELAAIKEIALDDDFSQGVVPLLAVANASRKPPARKSFKVKSPDKIKQESSVGNLMSAKELRGPSPGFSRKPPKKA